MTDHRTVAIPLLVKRELPRASAMMLTETFLAPGRRAMLLDLEIPGREPSPGPTASAVREPARGRPGGAGA